MRTARGTLPPALQGAARVHGAPSGRIDAGVAVPYDTGRVIGQANREAEGGVRAAADGWL